MRKIWAVDCAWGGGNIHTHLFLREDEAQKYFDDIPQDWYRKIYKCNDIWGWAERNA